MPTRTRSVCANPLPLKMPRPEWQGVVSAVHVVANRADKVRRFRDERGHRRWVLILEADSKRVVVDTNHRRAGQPLELEVTVLGDPWQEDGGEA